MLLLFSWVYDVFLLGTCDVMIKAECTENVGKLPLFCVLLQLNHAIYLLGKQWIKTVYWQVIGLSVSKSFPLFQMGAWRLKKKERDVKWCKLIYNLHILIIIIVWTALKQASHLHWSGPIKCVQLSLLFWWEPRCLKSIRNRILFSEKKKKRLSTLILIYYLFPLLPSFFFVFEFETEFEKTSVGGRQDWWAGFQDYNHSNLAVTQGEGNENHLAATLLKIRLH